MVTSFTRTRGRLLAPLALAAGLAIALAFLLLGSAEAGAAAKQKRVIGTAVSNGLRVQVTAIRSTQDTATVKIAAFEALRRRMGPPRPGAQGRSSARAGSGTSSPAPTGCGR